MQVAECTDSNSVSFRVAFAASLQLGPDGTVPECELQPEPGEGSDDDARSTDTYGQPLPPGYSSWAGP